MEPLKWSTQKRKVNDLIPYEHNPRTMSEKQVEDLTESLRKFGLVEIPAIDQDNVIIAGHQRLKILQLIGRGDEEIDVRVPNRKLTAEEFDEYNIRSNANLGQWNWDLLSRFDVDQLKDWGFDEMLLDQKMYIEEMEDNIELDTKYQFGTVNYFIRIGEHSCEITEDIYKKVKEKIESVGGLEEFINKCIE